MTTYLFAWNPKRWNWHNLRKMSEAIKAGDSLTDDWSCGNSKHIEKGDRAFLIRLGEEPKGIMASGTVVRGRFKRRHWDKAKADEGKTCYFVDVRFDTLLDPDTDPILPMQLLKAPPLSGMHWETQISGVRIPPEIAEELERQWDGFSSDRSILLAEEIKDPIGLYEGAVRRIAVNAYERNSEARRKCLDHYGLSCTICGFNFSEEYGEVGKGFIHVHHLKQISEIGEEYQIDAIRDLRPVCPNCHAMIHRREPPYTIKEMRTFIAKASSQK